MEETPSGSGLLRTYPWMPLASGPERLGSSAPIRVKPFCDSSVAA
jgi:hypothetical protein